MRVFKPQTLSLMTRPFEYRGESFCGISIMACASLGSGRKLFSEMLMWPTIAEALGPDAVIDEGIPKRGAEYLLAGHAYPQEDSKAGAARVQVEIGGLTKGLNVFGDRYFVRNQITRPEPFERIALTWENAFGGEGNPLNPVGKGIKPDDSGRIPLPNIEDPDEMLKLPGQKVRPAGFSAVNLMSRTRQKRAGTYDKRWLETEYPGFPADIDWRFFQIGAEDQQRTKPFSGDEEYVLTGVHPSQRRVNGKLPGIRARCFMTTDADGSLSEIDTRLTTVWFLPDQQCVVLVFHAAARVRLPDASDVATIMIAAEGLDESRDGGHYLGAFERRQDKDTGHLEVLDDKDLVPAEVEFEGVIGGSDSGFRPSAWGERAGAQTDRRLEEARQQLAKEGMDQGDEEPPRIQGLETDPDKLGSMKLPQLLELAEKLDEQGRQFAAGGQQRLDQGMKDLAEELKTVAPEGDEEGEQEAAVAVGPPRFSADEQMARIREQMAELEETGADLAEMKQSLLGDEMIAMLKNAEAGMLRMYRLTAHHQQAVPFNPEPARRKAFLAALAAGESLSGRDFSGVDLSDADLTGADLRGAFLESASLENARLDGARLDDAVLAHANLEAAHLDGAHAPRANFGRARMQEASAVAANLSGTILLEAGLKDADLSESNLEDAEIRKLEIAGTRLARANAPGIVLMDSRLDNVDFSGACLSDAIFIRTRFAEAGFDGANLEEAVFIGCDCRGARFKKARTRNLRLVEECDFGEVDFSGADLTEANLRGSVIESAIFDRADASAADFSETRAARCTFRAANVAGGRMVDAELGGADLSGADLSGASLERADLRGASVHGANLYQADLARVHVDHSTDFDEALTARMRTYPRKFPDSAEVSE